MGIENLMRSKARRASPDREVPGVKLEDGEETTGKPEDLNVILKDPVKSILFGIVLKKKYGAEADPIWNAYAGGDIASLKGDGFRMLSGAARDLGDALALSDRARGVFGEDALRDLAGTHEGFGDLFGLFSAVRAKEIVDAHLALLAVSEPDRLRTIMNAQHRINERKKSPAFTKANKQYETFQRKYNFKDEELESFLQIKDENERHNAIRDHMQKKYDGWRLFASPDSLARRAVREISAIERKTVIAGIYADLQLVGETLATFVHGNPEFVAGMYNELGGGEKIELQSLESATTWKDIDKRPELMNEEKILNKWRNQKNDIAKRVCGAGWMEKEGGTRILTPDDQNDVRDEFISMVKKELGEVGGVGFFSLVNNALYDAIGTSIIDDIEANKGRKLR